MVEFRLQHILPIGLHDFHASTEPSRVPARPLLLRDRNDIKEVVAEYDGKSLEEEVVGDAS